MHACCRSSGSSASSIWLEGHELLSVSWSEFSNAICSGVLETEPEYWADHADGIHPSRMLARLSELASELDLIVEVDDDWYRGVHLDRGQVVTAVRRERARGAR